jgi:hypothetical protein
MKPSMRGLFVAVLLGPVGCASNTGSGGSTSTAVDTNGSSSSGGGSTSGDDSSVATTTTGSGSSSSGGGSGSSSSSGGGTHAMGSDASAGGSNGGDATVSDAGASSVEDFVPTAADFDCLKDSEWTTIGESRFKNVLGHTAEMLSVARSATGGVYPVGTIVQLIPTEASAKRGAGYSAQSNDWEFFSLTVAASGTTISAAAGDASVVNFTGLSCLGCHSQAAPQWDFVCGDVDGGNTHGCTALPLTGAQLAVAQSTDPRCP